MYVKLTDGFYDSPKIVGAGNEAVGLYARALTYCAKHQTDGAIPRSIAAYLAAGHQGAIDALVKAELWEERDSDYFAPGYCEHNWDKEQYAAYLDAKREAGRKGGVASGEARAQASASASAQAKSKQSSTSTSQVPVTSKISLTSLNGGNGDE